MRVPQLVTVQIGAASRWRCRLSHGPLCPEELFSLIGEIADLRIGAIRFSLQNVLAVESLCRAAEYARRRGVETIVSLAIPALDAAGEIARVRPAAIATSLRSDDELALAEAIVRSGSPLEIETDATRDDIAALSAISKAAEELGATRWRIDFSGVRLPPPKANAAAEVILDAAKMLTVFVHEFGGVRREVIRRVRAGLPLPDLRHLHTIAAGESLTIAPCGDTSSGRSVRTSAFSRLCA